MRQVVRPALTGRAQAYLDGRQSAADQRSALGSFDIEREWKAASPTFALGRRFRGDAEAEYGVNVGCRLMF
jgi:hypothetical protein